MAECDHHPTYQYGSTTSSLLSQRGQNVNLQDELTWGHTYRKIKAKEKESPIPTKKSPMDIPFKICREKQRAKRGKKPPSDSAKTPQHQPKPKLSLLERNMLSQRKYMEYLSAPKQDKRKRPPPKKCKRPCHIEPCSPRVVQLAVPKKRRVFNNWQDFQHILSTPMIMKLQQILHTDKNLEPREARYYYKQLDKKRWKKAKEKRRLHRKANEEKDKLSKSWIKEQIELTTKPIIDFIKEEPLISLNYKQLLLSDGILDYLDEKDLMEKPHRTTSNNYKRTIIEICDKVAIWIDTLTRFVDVQPIETKEDIRPLTISSLGEGGEEEEETESESSEELWEESLVPAGLRGMTLGEEGLMGELFAPFEGEGESDLYGFLGELDLDLLDKLIKILESCSDEFLDGTVDEQRLPYVRYRDILERVKELRAGLLKKGPKKPFLEQVMLDWAIRNKPEEIDLKMRQKIQETAALLGDFLYGGADMREPVVEPPIEKGARLALGMGMGMGEGEDEGFDLSEAAAGAAGEGMTTEGSELAEGDETIVGVDLGKIGEGEGEEGGGFREGGEGGLGEGEESGLEGEDGRLGKGAGEESGLEGAGEEGLGEEGLGEEGAGEGGLDEALRKEQRMAALEAEGGDIETQFDMQALEREKEEGLLEGLEGEGYMPGLEEGFEVEGKEKEKEVSVLYEPGMELTADMAGKIIKGHKPSVIMDHSPEMVCCLSLKTWTVWLLEIAHNAHNWTKWIHCIINKVKEYAAIVRGEVLLPNGEKKVLYKEDWRKFAEETEEMITAWRQYSAHVKDLSNSIIENFRGKKVKCCPKCLQDHLIKNVVTAHETLEALTEAMNCAGYWQRCLDELVAKTCPLAEFDKEEKESSSSSEGESSDEESSESVYEIEEIEMSGAPQSDRGCSAKDPKDGASGSKGCSPGPKGCSPGPKR